jgi:hypothetical protein
MAANENVSSLGVDDCSGDRCSAKVVDVSKIVISLELT